MPKTSNLRSELLEIQQAGDKSFVISVSVWDAPGSKDAPHAVRFQFVTHRNPALWWKLSLSTARKGSGRQAAQYTNAQYNKAMRTATDAMNALITRENDELKAKRAPPPVTPNAPLPTLTYGTMPNEVAFLMSVSDRFESPFVFNMRLNERDAVTVLRAAELCDVQILQPESTLTTITSPRDMYKIIQSLQLMGEEFDDQRASDLASAILGMAGFNWI